MEAATSVLHPNSGIADAPNTSSQTQAAWTTDIFVLESINVAFVQVFLCDLYRVLEIW